MAFAEVIKVRYDSQGLTAQLLQLILQGSDAALQFALTLRCHGRGVAHLSLAGWVVLGSLLGGIGPCRRRLVALDGAGRNLLVGMEAGIAGRTAVATHAA